MTQTTEIASPPIEGRVAQILNERELVINVGSGRGVKPGMKFAVLSETPIEIRDPETSKVLDVVDREKVRVEAVEVRPQITICRTYRTKGGPLFPDLASTLSILRDRPLVRETLRAEDDSLPKPLSPEESYVKIKDRVIQVKE